VGAIIIGIVAGIIPWLAMNKLAKGQLHDEGGRYTECPVDPRTWPLTGGLLTGILPIPRCCLYIGTARKRPAST